MRVWRVGELTYHIKALLESDPGRVEVVGELSSVKTYSSGHMYFTLKDDAARLSGVMWRSKVRGLGFAPEDGMEVVVSGVVTVYPPRGQYQIVADSMALSGAGRLKYEFERVKARLEAEGLLDQARKRSIPAWPRRICLVTSPDGAALRDLVRVIHGRAPWVELVVSPALVQGEAAPDALIRALLHGIRHAGADYLVIARGGGSVEDLGAFNHEGLAREIAASPIPVVSAVGHETDWTIADLVADLRVATPSHAGMLVPDRDAVATRLGDLTARVRLAIGGLLRDRRMTLMQLALTVEAARPENRIRRMRDSLARSYDALVRVMESRVRGSRAAMERAAERLVASSPAVGIRLARQRLSGLGTRLDSAQAARIAGARGALGALVGRLDALSPLAVLDRGYAMVRNARSHALVTAPRQVSAGDLLEIRVSEGIFHATVEPGERIGE